MRRSPILLYFLGLAVLLISACSSTAENRSLKTYDPLIRAGFVVREADTPRKLEIVRTLPQRTVVPFSYQGRQLYIYAMESCQCAYVGEEENYARLTHAIREDQPDKRSLYSISPEHLLLTPGIDDDQLSFILGR